jgi:hypothetical protein
MEKKPFRVVSIALAKKLARIGWVVLTRKEAFRPFPFADRAADTRDEQNW